MVAGSRIRLLAAAGVLAMSLFLGACASTDDASVPPRSDASTDSFSAGGLQDPSAPQESAAAASTPVRVQIPSIGVDSALESLTLEESGRLQAPVDFNLAGWYAGGVVPGEVGPAIIAGHVDSPTAPAVFIDIGSLVVGDEIIITSSDGSVQTFQVSGSMQSAKAEFPTAAVYSNVPTPELRLITCGGVFDSSTGHYLDNLIVFAELRA